MYRIGHRSARERVNINMKYKIIIMIMIICLLIPLTGCRSNVEYAAELVAYINDNTPQYIECCYSKIDNSSLAGARILIQFEGITCIEDVNQIIESYNNFIKDNNNYFDSGMCVEVAFHFDKLHSYETRFATAINRYDDMILNELYLGNSFVDYQIKDLIGMFDEIEVLHIDYLNLVDREDIEALNHFPALQDVYIQVSESSDNMDIQELINDVNPTVDVHII